MVYKLMSALGTEASTSPSQRATVWTAISRLSPSREVTWLTNRPPRLGRLHRNERWNATVPKPAASVWWPEFIYAIITRQDLDHFTIRPTVVDPVRNVLQRPGRNWVVSPAYDNHRIAQPCYQVDPSTKHAVGSMRDRSVRCVVMNSFEAEPS